MKILFYGDSNTYGFDPRDFFGGRYEVFWTELLRDELGGKAQVINEGMNGREIPSGEYDLKFVSRRLDKLEENDIFAVMLGTNDLLNSFRPDPNRIVCKMAAFVEWFLRQPAHPELLLVSPPYISSDLPADPAYAEYYKASLCMNEGFRKLSEKSGIMFLDSGSWGVELAYDHVHFSEAGHKTFAGKMAAFLEEILKNKFNEIVQ